MSSLRHSYLIAYDIEDNKTRTALFKRLEDYGLKPVQKSIFWGFLTHAERNALQYYVAQQLAESDRCFIIPSPIDFHHPRATFFGYNEQTFTDWKTHDVL